MAIRLRARLLRTFRGRSAADAGWTDEEPVSAGAPESFELGRLVIDVTPRGLKAAGINHPSIVYVVSVGLPSEGRAWSSSYGFPPRQASARRAAEAALDELDEVARDPEAWVERVTDGMTEEEAEAMIDSPGMENDRHAAEWCAAELAPRRAQRQQAGSWLAA